MFENTVYPGISATLDTLQSAGHPLWVATSKPRVFADRIIDHFALRPYFRRVYGSELDGTRSAKADLLGYLLQHESLDPAYTVMIGDREHDIVGARTAGIAAIGVTWGYGSRAELLAASPATVIDQPLELMAAVRGMQRTGAR